MKCIYKPEYEHLIKSTMRLTDISRQIGVSIPTIAIWRHRAKMGLPAPKPQYRFDYDLMDKMLAEGKGTAEIVKAIGCSPTAIYRRNKKRTGKVKPPEVHVEQRKECIPPAERLSLAQRNKMKGWSPAHRMAFLHGPEAARWAAQIAGGAA